MTRYNVVCKHCEWQKNITDKEVAYRYAGFHEGENLGHNVEVEER